MKTRVSPVHDARIDQASVRPGVCAWRAGQPASDKPEDLSFACAILESIPQKVAVLNGNGVVVAANTAWQAHCSARPGSFAPAVGGSFGDAAGSGVDSVLAGGLATFGMEFAVPDQDGQAWFSLQVTPMCEAWSGATVSVTDITERKQIEERQRIAAIAFESPQGMLLTDAQGKILLVNKAFTDITGYSLAEVLHKSPSVLSSGRHGPEFYSAMRSAIASAGVWSGEIWNRRKDGSIFPEWLTITVVRCRPT